MKMSRRSFLKSASLGAACLAAGTQLDVAGVAARKEKIEVSKNAYKYRIAFGAWMNDMRCDSLPLQEWPAPQFDDETVRSIIRALDVQSKAGFEYLDAWGYFATHGYPPDIVSTFADKDRRKRVQTIIKAAKDRGMKHVLGLGTYSWGYDEIIKHDPSVAGKNPDGSPSTCVMCDANPKSFEYVKKILDTALSQFDFDGVHLESCDQGCCRCPECAGQDDIIPYNCRINTKTADYIKSKWPDKFVYVITINWLWGRKHYNDDDKAHILKLSKHIDCLFDQGHSGYQLDPAERREFIPKMGSAYGTSGKLWLYPDVRWDRSSYFLPFVKRSGEALKQEYQDGVRGCMFYQGPMNNPGTEVHVAVGGRILADTSRDVEDTLGEVIELYHKPKTAQAQRKLVGLFLRAEDSYFGNWPRQTEQFMKLYGFVPGEFKLWQGLFGTTPGPASYLREPMLDKQGRQEYKKGLVSILEELPTIEGSCDDRGRIQSIKKACTITLNMVNTISSCLGEG